jgi:hypothetical protein
VTVEGHGSFLCEPHELDSMLADMNESGEEKLAVEHVWMTDDAFERLPEFTGF